MQISKYIQNTALTYPFLTLTALANGLILDIRIIASDFFTTIIVDLIKALKDYLYLSILASSSDNKLWVKKYFLCNTVSEIILAKHLCSSSDTLLYILDCYILLNKLPDYTIHIKDNIELNRSIISYTKHSAPTSMLNFLGYISVEKAPIGYIQDLDKLKLRLIVFRNINPGYLLSATLMSSFLNKLIKRINTLPIPKKLLLYFPLSDTITYKTQLNQVPDSKIITLYLYPNTTKLGCD